ncbi:MAG: Maf family protein [Shimia sp.]
MIVLASGSQTRADMLARAGVVVDVIRPRVDEDALKAALAAEGASPRDVVDTLAEAKARKVAGQGHAGPVIGSDQILVHDGAILSKPGTAEKAAQQLARLSGQTHRLMSAAVIYCDGAPVWRAVESAQLTMRPLSPDFIDRYVARNWSDIASSVGGYKVEAEGARLFARIDGDLFTVLGMPLIQVLGYLVRSGDIDG